MSPAATGPAQLLADFLRSANKIAKRLKWSHDRLDGILPIASGDIERLSDEQEERLDAFLLRFNALTVMIQDHVTRALLLTEEEDIKDRSRKDQRLLMEKLGAFSPTFDFGSVAELRNRIAHHYPDDPDKQAEILNAVFVRSVDLLRAHDDVLDFADRKLFGRTLGLAPIGPPDMAKATAT